MFTQDGRAAGVEAAAGQADAAQARDDDEYHKQCSNQPDPPDYPALSIHPCNHRIRYSPGCKYYRNQPVNPWSLSQ